MSTLNPRKSKVQRVSSKLASLSSRSSTNDEGLKILCYMVDFLSGFCPAGSSGKEGLDRVYESIFMSRYVGRFWGFGNAVDGMVNGSWGEPEGEGSWSGAQERNDIARLQAACMACYHPLEIIAWLGWVTKWKRRGGGWRDPDKMSAWSCRFWLLYILLNLVKNGKKLNAISSAERGGRSSGQDKGDSRASDTKGGGSPQDDADDVPESKTVALCEISRREAKVAIVKDVCYALPALTWSLPQWSTKPILSKKTVNMFCMAEALVNLWELIKK